MANLQSLDIPIVNQSENEPENQDVTSVNNEKSIFWSQLNKVIEKCN